MSSDEEIMGYEDDEADRQMNLSETGEAGDEEEGLEQQRKRVKLFPPIDISKASTNVWLVKLPSFLADSWRKAEPGKELGVIRVVSDGSSSSSSGSSSVPPSVSLHLSDNHSNPVNSALSTSASSSNLPGLDSAQQQQTQQTQLPKNYTIKFTSKPAGDMLTFTEDLQTGQCLAIDGTVQYECNAVPVIDEDYTRIMRLRRAEAERPKRVTQFVEAKGNIQAVKHISTSFVTNTSQAYLTTKRRKNEERRDRLPREEILEIMFKLFAKEQYRTLKDLVEITNQPVAYMKEILSEIAVYLSRGPYKTHYQLKPEYQTSPVSSESANGTTTNPTQ